MLPYSLTVRNKNDKYHNIMHDFYLTFKKKDHVKILEQVTQRGSDS